MRSVQVSDRTVTMWFSGEKAPGGRKLAALVRRTLEERGMEPWAETEAERFDAGEDTLVIARPGPPRPRAFFFPGLEELLTGALSCPDGPSALYRTEGGYLLTVAPENVRPGLYEFGAVTALPLGWEDHAREQGRCVTAGNAVADLRRAFATDGPCYTDVC